MMNDFANIFIEEANELLSHLEADLLALEKEPANKEILEKVFRVMHTLKGNAGMCGFTNIQVLTHEYESIFDKIREGELTINAEIIDLTLKGKDAINAMLRYESPEGLELNLIEFLHEKYSTGPVKGSEKNVQEAVTKTSKSRLFAILFTPDKAVFERGLNPDKTIAELTNSGKSNVIPHENNMSWEAQKAKKVCFTTWEIYLSSESSFQEVVEIFMFYEPDEYSIYEVSTVEAPEAELLSGLQKLHSEKADIEEHLRACIAGLTHETVEEMASTSTETEVVAEARTPREASAEADMTINVSSGKLDELMNLVSELVSQTAMLEASTAKVKNGELRNIVENLEKLTKRFRTNALDLRLVPVGTLLSRFERQIRDLSKDLNKQVSFIIEGQDVEIDKTILKSIEKPMVHIIRNSIDHGIELPDERIKKGKKKEGLLKICAFHSGVNIIIQVQDDGRGIDLEKVREYALKKGYIQSDQVVTDQDLINLILEPGFTTNENISLISGRGVGMDVVKKELNAVGGTVEVFTEKNLGTTITMKLPTTLTIIDTLMVEVGQSIILVPMLDIEYCYKEQTGEILKKDNRYVQFKNKPIPFVSLRDKFKYPVTDKNDLMVIILNKFDKTYAIIADRILGEYQAVIKPLGDLFANQPFFSGGSIMVDGKLALILDTSYLFTQLNKT